MKLAIIGDKDFDDYEYLCQMIADEDLKPSLILFDCKGGTSSLAEKYANDNDIDKRINLASSNNESIIDEADMVLAFWDGESSYTGELIEYAENKDKFLVTIYYKNRLV